ncbi:alpha/beta hydrolase [Virgibacillus sp. NKC19-3]|uniref:alpha/beta hydrolase n=1 Tax=Virgibacillus saliphilus TaxID=2831674 RepID=UPI001C9AD2AB|nr:alpha/beta hydrolase [Virgibacillus sp. NKC19-3]MBY7142010.1 alpha/beta hydrolase [Virgibacillus sp. NKC19-3]
MTLDPQLKFLLEQMDGAEIPPMHTLTLEEARQTNDMRFLTGEPEPVERVEDHLIPGPSGKIPVRIYTPVGDNPLPALVYYHGGGWVIGDLEYADIPCRMLANRVNCVVISVDYRLAPEHKFPSALEDAYAAIKWVVENASELHVNPEKVAVGGDSAGGNLAAAVTLMVRDKKTFTLCHQLLIYPITDHRFDTTSYQDNAEGYFLTKDNMIWFWNHYLHHEEDGKHPYASPLRANDLKHLPPALIITAEHDPLRDEGEAYAERLKTEGTPVEATRYTGMIHGFFSMPGALTKSQEAIEQASNGLKQAFASNPNQLT